MPEISAFFLSRSADSCFKFAKSFCMPAKNAVMSTVDLTDDWKGWKASPPVELLRPEAPYECATLPNVPSEPGDVNVPVRQLRDPGVVEENGRTYLFYSICGEQGIAAAELTIR